MEVFEALRGVSLCVRDKLGLADAGGAHHRGEEAVVGFDVIAVGYRDGFAVEAQGRWYERRRVCAPRVREPYPELYGGLDNVGLDWARLSKRLGWEI